MKLSHFSLRLPSPIIIFCQTLTSMFRLLQCLGCFNALTHIQEFLELVHFKITHIKRWSYNGCSSNSWCLLRHNSLRYITFIVLTCCITWPTNQLDSTKMSSLWTLHRGYCTKYWTRAELRQEKNNKIMIIKLFAFFLV